MATVLVYEFYKLSTKKESYANLPQGMVLPAKPAVTQPKVKAEANAAGDDAFWAAYNGRYEHLKPLRAMLEAGVLKSDVDRGMLLEILKNVHWLHKQRNEINHAKNDSYVVSNQEIIDCMLKTMDAIEEVGKQSITLD